MLPTTGPTLLRTLPPRALVAPLTGGRHVPSILSPDFTQSRPTAPRAFEAWGVLDRSGKSWIRHLGGARRISIIHSDWLSLGLGRPDRETSLELLLGTCESGGGGGLGQADDPCLPRTSRRGKWRRRDRQS